MSIFFKESKFHSEINGELTLRRCWNGSWTLLVPEGEWYGSSYLEKMWRAVLKKFQNNLNPKNVLVLGAGAGCAIQVLKDLWPKARADAVDYDKTILDVGKQIYNNFGNFNPHFIVSDAALFVKNCEKKLASLKRERSGYDLIIVDLFVKNSASPLLKDTNFVSEISRILEKPGAVITNAATKLSGEDGEIFKVWSDIFPGAINLRFRDNLLFLAEKSGIPEDYYGIFQTNFWAKFLEKRGLVAVLGEEPRIISKELYGAERGFVYVWRLPFGLGVINAMHTDKEPDVAALKNFGCCHGIIFWTPWERKTARPPTNWSISGGARWPWLKSLIPLHQKGNGFSYVAPAYRSKWSEMARRNLKKFEASGAHVGSATADAFIGGLKSSTLKSSLKEGFASMIKDADLSALEFWTAQIPAMNAGQEDGKILGGLAVVNYGNISAHFVAYSSKEGRELQAATGLIDCWFKYALERNVKYLNFGHIRQKREPLSWRGYSDFKRRFIDQEICLSNGYWRVF